MNRWLERLSLVIATLFLQTIFLNLRTSNYLEVLSVSQSNNGNHLSSSLLVEHRPIADDKRPSFLPKTLVNFTASQGYEAIGTPMVMDAAIISQYRQHYSIKIKPVVYFITPTYRRPTQLLDLVQVSQSIQHDKATYWIVIEDATEGSKRVRDLLERSGLLFAHLAIPSAKPKKKLSKQKMKVLNAPRGVLQRNLGLDTVESLGMPGVVYFGDDDNKYDARLMEAIRYTKGVGIFSVGFRGEALYCRCKVDETTGKVVGTTNRWFKNKVNYAMDMAGFCANSELIREKHARFLSNSPPGKLEHMFLQQLVHDVSEMEPLLNNCTLIYSWHVKTSAGKPHKPNDSWDSAWKQVQPAV